jgi:cell division protein FtsB
MNVHPIIKKILGYLRNKYITASVLFFVWVGFFDRNDLISEMKLMYKINKLKTERSYYQKQTDAATQDLKELQTNPANLEKFAREKYLMKKDNEDVYVIVDQNNKLLDTLHVVVK